ncbi:MAG: hypothetical protein BIFFINMI_03908 [Phycisphaerae bacterium]|nr:hypothetical protein [Phycisphaerae bacterium]
MPAIWTWATWPTGAQPACCGDFNGRPGDPAGLNGTFMLRLKAATSRVLGLIALAAILGTLCPLGGCLELDTHIVLNPDGSADIHERLLLTSQLLDLGGKDLAALLEKPAFLERMKHMGGGVTLVSHKVEDAEKGARQAVAVYHIPDLGNLVYIAPFLPRQEVSSVPAMKFTWHAPMRDGSSWEYLGGWMGVQFQPQYPPATRRREPTSQPDEPTPADLQVLRTLQPVFADMMKGLSIRINFESYAPILKSSFGWRDSRSATHKVDLIDFAPDRDSDKYGYPLLDNEEIMLDLLRGRLDSPTITDHLKDWTTNATLPVFHREGAVYFQPSMPLFKRFFEGKTLYHHRIGDVPARFEEIGWKGDPGAPRKEGG